MDWAARFIDGIYNDIGSNTYVNEMLHSAPTVMGKRTVEAVAEALGLKPVYDEIRKTVRFL